jgi:hypothetical protein
MLNRPKKLQFYAQIMSTFVPILFLPVSKQHIGPLQNVPKRRTFVPKIRIHFRCNEKVKRMSSASKSTKLCKNQRFADNLFVEGFKAVNQTEKRRLQRTVVNQSEWTFDNGLI